MSDFTAVIERVIKARQTGPGIAFDWVVEAIFADPKDPQDGLSAVLGVFIEEKEAQSFATKLTTECSFDFLAFRARRMHIFHPLVGGDTAILTESDEFNQAVLKRVQDQKKRETEHEQKQQALELQTKHESKPGTPENVSRLIHLCVRNQVIAKQSRHTAEEAEKAYAQRFEQLRESIASRPEVAKEWLEYITPLLRQFKDEAALDQMQRWWSIHSDKLIPKAEEPDKSATLPLPEKAD